MSFVYNDDNVTFLIKILLRSELKWMTFYEEMFGIGPRSIEWFLKGFVCKIVEPTICIFIFEIFHSNKMKKECSETF